MKASPIAGIALALVSLALPACDMHKEEHSAESQQRIVVTTPLVKDITLTQPYVCQIHSQCSIEVCPLVGGRLEEIAVREGQLVKKGDPMFRILPTLYQAKLAAELARVDVAKIEFIQAEKLNNETPPVVSKVKVALFKAKLAEAQATANRTKTEVEFTTVYAPFDGIVDRLQKQLGSTIKEGEVLTTMTDNSVMWVYFNVPEVRYLEYKASLGKDIDNHHLELVLADGSTFPQPCKVVKPLGQFNSETGNIPFRADFPNPDALLRHGQTGNMLVHRTLKDAVIIPQRATFEVLDKRYVYILGADHVVHQRGITILQELDDIFVIKKGLEPGEQFILEGVRQVHDKETREFEFRKPEEAMANLKFHAE